MNITTEVLGVVIALTPSKWTRPLLVTLAILTSVLSATGCDDASDSGVNDSRSSDSRSDDSGTHGPGSGGDHRGTGHMDGNDSR